MGSLLPHNVISPVKKAFSFYQKTALEVCFGILETHHESGFEIDDEPEQPPHPHAFWWDYMLAIPRANHY